MLSICWIWPETTIKTFTKQPKNQYPAVYIYIHIEYYVHILESGIVRAIKLIILGAIKSIENPKVKTILLYFKKKCQQPIKI